MGLSVKVYLTKNSICKVLLIPGHMNIKMYSVLCLPIVLATGEVGAGRSFELRASLAT
jgi:hypothetical protein